MILLPTWLSLAVFAMAVLCIRSQVRQEEAYLLRTYGDEYRAFASRVGRFFPGLGLGV
jgi:protein-S-isoprenylcysteine O-methyltransferase Ste14